MTRLERISANYKSLADEYPDAAPIRAMLSGPMADLLAVAEAARGVTYESDRVSGHDILVHKLRFERLVAALAPLLEKVEEPPGIPSAVRKCNRHADCDKAEMAWRARHPIGKNLPMSFHCHDDCCEECFGN